MPGPTASVGAAGPWAWDRGLGPLGPALAAPTEAVGLGRARAQIILLFVLLGYYFRLFPY